MRSPTQIGKLVTASDQQALTIIAIVVSYIEKRVTAAISIKNVSNDQKATPARSMLDAGSFQGATAVTSVKDTDGQQQSCQGRALSATRARGYLHLG